MELYNDLKCEAQAFTIKDFMVERIFNEFLILIHPNIRFFCIY